VRWCGQCAEHVREFSARPPLHTGDYVAHLTATGPQEPHFSRWEASATTFGPIGRVAISLGIIAFLVSAGFWLFFLLWIPLAIASVVVLRDVWKPGWVVPDAGSEDERDADREHPSPIPPGIPGVARSVESDAPRSGRVDAAAVRGWILAGAAVAALVGALTFGSVQIQAAAISVATLVGLYAFFRSFLV
jgi:hypothetical protein